MHALQTTPINEGTFQLVPLTQLRESKLNPCHRYNEAELVPVLVRDLPDEVFMELLVADNIAAIAAHIDALRRIDRYGVGELERAFLGYAALPAPTDWRAVLGNCRTRDEAETAFRRLARTVHPDLPGGDSERMAEANRAIEAARAALPA